MVEIIWNKNIDEENRQKIEKYLKPFLWLVPKWCNEVCVNLYNSDGGDNAAIRTGISYEYRHAVMDFFTSWLNQSDYDKGLHVVHDLLHIPTSIYVDFAEGKLKLLCPESENEKFNKSLLEDSRVMCESMVQDLAKAVYDRFSAEMSLGLSDKQRENANHNLGLLSKSKKPKGK